MSQAPTKRSTPTVTLTVLAVGAVTFVLLQSLVAPALPDIQKELDGIGGGRGIVLAGVIVDNVR